MQLSQVQGTLPRGAVFRLPGEYPHEDQVQLMLVELAGKLGLLVTTGHKAGLLLVYLPAEATDKGAVDADWLKANWRRWVYPTASPAQVEVLNHPDYDGYQHLPGTRQRAISGGVSTPSTRRAG